MVVEARNRVFFTEFRNIEKSQWSRYARAAKRKICSEQQTVDVYLTEFDPNGMTRASIEDTVHDRNLPSWWHQKPKSIYELPPGKYNVSFLNRQCTVISPSGDADTNTYLPEWGSVCTVQCNDTNTERDVRLPALLLVQTGMLALRTECVFDPKYGTWQGEVKAHPLLHPRTMKLLNMDLFCTKAPANQ